MDEWIRQAEVWVGQAESWVRQQPPEQIYISAAVVALTILVLAVGACPALIFACYLIFFHENLSVFEYCVANSHGVLGGLVGMK